MSAEDLHRAPALADALASKYNSDVVLYSGAIDFPYDRKVSTCCQGIRRENCFLILSTWGGDPHAAFRISRFLQQSYTKVTVFIPSYCKSAGTLLALGAHELVMSDFGELGPLDIQVARRDELGEMSSGLVVNEALVSLQQRAINTFNAVLRDLKDESFGQITLKTAMQTAREMTVGLLAPIYNQIEPMHLGELTRAMKITEHYGKRLSEHSKNLKREALQSLVAAYPSHYISIDRLEAQTLFVNVRPPSEQEAELAEALQDLLVVPSEEKTVVVPLSKARKETDDATAHDRGDSAGAGAQATEAVGSTGKGRGPKPKDATGGGANGREQRPPEGTPPEV